MSKFLVFGAGFVVEPLVEYLKRREENSITIASNILSEAQNLAAKFDDVNAIEADVTNAEEVENLVANYDLVVSLVPAPLHPLIANACIKQGKNMVTASYLSKEMAAMSEEAKKAGVTIMNEIGLDPGIDHLSAMKIIDEAQAKGHKVRTFVSFCGGLPAPEDNNNPLGYKFSWAPKGVLTAVLNDALFLQNGTVETVKAKDLLAWAKPFKVGELDLEGYPNRDSTPYQEIYGIPEAQNIIRGTLRYKESFCDIIQAAKALKLLDFESDIQATDNMDWVDYIAQLNGVEDINHKKSEFEQLAWDGLEWIGCFSENKVGNFDAPIDAFCELLKQKLDYKPGEKDMIALQHKFHIEDEQGKDYYIESSLTEIGQADGYNAMSKTVGYPAAMACQLIVDGQIDRKGMVLPMTPDIYLPILELLEKEGIRFTEREFTEKGDFLAGIA